MTDYNAMSLDELLREEKKQYASYHGEGSLHITFVICERRAARDAILDLAEQLDADGLVVVPREATPDMDYEGAQAFDSTNPYLRDTACNIYAAMIAAAPLPASPSSVEG